jgi:DNA-binding transcriptional regulator YiaG
MVLRKNNSEALFYGFGFPVLLLNPPLKECDGELILDLDLKALADRFAAIVALKPARLTGNEIRFLRLHFQTTLDELGARLDVTRQAIIKWEKRQDDFTEMKWPTEKDLRLWAIEKIVSPKDLKDFRLVFDSLRDKRERKKSRFKIAPREIAKRSRADIVRRCLSTA